MTLGSRLRTFAPPPRVVDWGILVVVTALLATGLLSWTGWLPAALLVDVHGILGLSLVGLLAFKFARVARRVTDRRNWDRTTPVSVVLGVIAVAALSTGIFWSAGGNVPVLGWTTLNLHVGLGLLVIPVLLWHLRDRFRLPRRTDASRRSALRVGALLVAGTVAWRATDAVADAAGRTKRYTGSKPIGELADTDTAGGAFPVTSWVADDPDPIDRETWSLEVGGLVDAERAWSYADLADTGNRYERRTTLDCTSGWYTVQDWGGVRVGDLLESAGVAADARWVRFESVTGYRWSLPVEEARLALLATHVGGRPLSHGHGAPLRLVAPGRRGFQWVKWVNRIEVRRRSDPMQWVVTLVSGFD
jgi:DMSO/TMAO reductase YedYZ molybdopterin-dependent catalytic subunit